MSIWRIHLKSASKAGVDPRQLCFDKDIVGVGWQIDYDTVPVPWEEYLDIAGDFYGTSSWKKALNAIKTRIQVNDLIWSRDRFGNYYLGRILSDWYYDTSIECAHADIVNVRKCKWHKIGTAEDVPGKVVSSFRSTLTVQAIYDDAAYKFSQIAYNDKEGQPLYNIDKISDKNIFSLLSSDDCEDALAIFLQINHDYFIIPSSCKSDTMAYEFVLKHRQTGKSAVAQVKSGNISLNIDNFSNLETDIFLFATSGLYSGSPRANVITINPVDVQKFLYEHVHLLPDKIKNWLNLTL